MKPASFELFRPTTIDEALHLLNRFGDDARLISGGQSLVPMMNLRLATPGILIDLNGIERLSGVTRVADRVVVGAMTRQQFLLQNEIIRKDVPLLARALSHVGHYQTRCRGTIGGSLSHADPSAEMSLVALTLGATLTIQKAGHVRIVTPQDFFQDAMITVLEAEELLAEISFPVASDDCRIAFHEFSRKHGDFAIAAAAAQWSPSQKTLTIGLGGVTSTPFICQQICEAAKAGAPLVTLEELIEAELDQIEPLEDVHTSAGYRRELGSVCLSRCLRELFF